MDNWAYYLYPTGYLYLYDPVRVTLYATIKYQYSLNPSMQEVKKKEIIKWLNIGVVYPSSNNKWISHIQCVTKKRGMTMVANEKNELIPLRSITGW